MDGKVSSVDFDCLDRALVPLSVEIQEEFPPSIQAFHHSSTRSAFHQMQQERDVAENVFDSDC
jgi:hypothetical protein